MVVYGETITARVQATVLKKVQCSHCGCQFVYKMRRLGVGEGSNLLFLNEEGATKNASEAAEKSLASELKGFDAVPCIKCGMYQQYMLDEVRRQQFGGLSQVALLLFLIGLLIMAAALIISNVDTVEPGVSTVLGAVAAPAIISSIVLFFIRRKMCQAYDPNLGDKELRLEIARSRAISRQQFEEENIPVPEPPEA